MNYIKKYLVIGILLFVLAMFAYVVTWGNALLIFSSEVGWLARGLYILPILIALLGFVKNSGFRISLSVIAAILFLLIVLNSFIFGFVKI